MASGEVRCRPKRLETEPDALKPALAELMAQLAAAYPDLPNPRWIAVRLLDGDDSIVAALKSGRLADLGLPRRASATS